MIKLLLMFVVIQIGDTEPIELEGVIRTDYTLEDQKYHFVTDDIFNDGFEQGVSDGSMG